MCGSSTGLLNTILAKFALVGAGLFVNGLAAALFFGAAYAGFRALLLGIESLPMLKQGLDLYLQQIAKVLVPMALTFGFIQALPVLWAASLNAAQSAGLGPGGAITAITPSVVWGQFLCMAAGVEAAGGGGGLLTGLTGNIIGALEQWALTQIVGLTLIFAGAFLAGALVFILSKAYITVPVGAPLLGGLLGPDGKSIAVGYLSHLIGTLIEVALASVIVGIAEEMTLEFSAMSITMAATNDMTGLEAVAAMSVLLALFAWFLPLIASRTLSGAAAVTVMAVYPIIRNAFATLTNAATKTAQIATGNAPTGTGGSGKAEGSDGSRRSSGGGKGFRVYGRQMP